MNHVVIVADMEVMDLTAAAGCQVCQQQRPTVSPGVALVPGMTSQPPGGTPAALDHFLLGKASIFPYWNRYLFLHIMPLHSHPPGLTKNFIHHHGVQRSIASDQGTDFIAREVWAWAYVLLCSHHSEAASLIEWQNGLLKTLLKHQLSGSSLDGWGGVLQKVVCALNQSPACARYSFSHSQNPWVQDSRRWNRNGSTHCHPGDLLDDVSAIVVVHLTQHLSLSNKCVCVHFISSVPLENPNTIANTSYANFKNKENIYLFWALFFRTSCSCFSSDVHALIFVFFCSIYCQCFELYP